jgi:diguanylate cyclase (GGDEF)-like protein/PAS domain S-box-containing protein
VSFTLKAMTISAASLAGGVLLCALRMRGVLEREAAARGRVEASLGECEDRFRQIFEHSVDAVFVHDEGGRIVDCNSEACRSLGYTRQELLSLTVRDFATNLIPEGMRRDDALWRQTLSGAPGRVTGVHVGEHRRKDGTTFPVEVRVGSLDLGGRHLILAAARDVTERMELEEQLRHRAFHDALTGLPNRALFSDRLEHALARTRRSGSRVAVLFIDLDGFKEVNDLLGHEAGDSVLVEVAGALAGCLRTEDTVARHGGDEFTVLLEGVSQQEEAILVAGRVIEGLRGLAVTGGPPVTASVGISLSSSPEEDPRELIRRADSAMYRAKRSGKDRYAIEDPEPPVSPPSG